MDIRRHVQNECDYRLECGITKSKGKSQPVLRITGGWLGEVGLSGGPSSRRLIRRVSGRSVPRVFPKPQSKFNHIHLNKLKIFSKGKGGGQFFFL